VPGRRWLVGGRRLIVDITPLRESRDFRRLWSSQLFTVWCRQVVIVAMPYQVYIATHSSLVVGLLGVTQAVAIIGTGLYGGGFIDRFDRRRVQIAAKVAAGIASLALAVGGLHPALTPTWIVFALAAVGTAAWTLDQSARAATVPRLVEARILPSALSLGQVLNQGGQIIGPAAGGLVIGFLGLTWAYGIDALGCIPATILVASLTPQLPIGTSVRRGWRAPAEGVAFVRKNPVLIATFAADLNATIFGMPTAVFPALALTIYRIGPTGLGLLYAAPATGAFVATLLSGWVPRVRRQGAFIVGAIAIWGLAIAGFGIAGSVRWLGLLLLAIAGAGDMVSAVFRQTILQMSVPDSIRGRLSAFNMMVVMSGPRLGDLEAGAVAALFTPVISVVSGGLLCVAGIAAIASLNPTLRRYRLPAAAEVAIPETDVGVP
jgi:MFS family permease